MVQKSLVFSSFKNLIADYPQNKPELLKYINCFKEYIEGNRSQFDLEKIDNTRSVPLDVQSLLNDSKFREDWPTFDTDLFEKPEHTLRLLEFCFHEVT